MAAGSAASSAQVEFTGRRLPLLGLLLKNGVLTVLTLGIYRFWTKTWVRRYFWNNIRIGGDPLEYTGLPHELFIGFLIALAVLFPLGLVYGWLGVFLEAAPVAQAALQISYFALLFVLLQVAFYRMWRYRMTRTAWRGVRFGLDGSTWDFLWLSVGWTLLAAATLGLAYPWMRVALVRYRTRHSRFGSEYFAFDGSGKGLIGSWIGVWGLPVVTAVLIAIYGLRTEAGLRVETLTGPGILTSMILAALLWFWLYLRYRVGELRYMIGCTGLAAAAFRSRASPFAILGLAVLTVGLLVGLLNLVFGVAYWSLTAPGEVFEAAVLPAVLAVFAGLILWPVVSYGVFRFGLVGHVCRTLEIENPQVFDRIVQSADKAPRFGEGLADAFDVGAI